MTTTHDTAVIDLAEGIDLNTTEGGREFVARLFRQRLERQDFTGYINTELAGDFAYHLARFLAPELKTTAPQVEPAVQVPFVVGNFYRTLGGSLVRFVRTHNEGMMHETMEDEAGIHRYTRRDFGRVTGTDHHTPDPRNVLPLFQLPPQAAQQAIERQLQLDLALVEIETLKQQLAQAQADGLARAAQALREHESSAWLGSKGHHTGIIHAAVHLETLATKGRVACSGEVAPSAPSAAAPEVEAKVAGWELTIEGRHSQFVQPPDYGAVAQNLQQVAGAELHPLVHQAALTQVQQERDLFKERAERFLRMKHEECRRADAAEHRANDLQESLEDLEAHYGKASGQARKG
ncbi:hypothetical protein RBE51_20815 [Pseudomonas taiwanensis]|uniref:hypothetical protein n=1 Tax=Pseudomonas taiwanensis TaxID=470150 RepID=UPI0028DE6E11|nr:hypothetical protein [Pseudomonas taiwanensis]MDT8925239.1 hypothetical protein [Pseudomonas taiwanensis]